MAKAVKNDLRDMQDASLEYAMFAIECALGICCDLADWYACGDELI